jgi:hypothetical protein
VVLSQKKPEPKPVVQVEPPKPVVAPPVEAPKPVEAAKPTEFTMQISTQPAGAEVFNGPERLGTTPCKVVLPASEKPVELTLKKRGYKEQKLEVVPDKDHDFLADLMPAAKPHTPSKPVKSTAPAATPTQATPDKKPDQPKPAGKLRDLKDPFAN